ncbi:LysR family transcriptional regulator [Vibrio sp. MA64]|uniref:LysR family transcriptional regulator n=1 Tax=Vibrio sp. MA64 TaxID=2896365 RepID=UPI001E3DEEA8|nr:LysR family transcriptional regulator [Vibrio sp. MA64]MCC9650202.1 LysR family transcriptional regulator [Vibrio sp. MA64]
MKSIPSQLPIFIEVAKEKSFSAAARNLGISTPAVSKAINKLESQWKLKLFHRSSHSLSLTSVGHTLAMELEPAVEGIFSAIATSQEINGQLSGVIKVNLPGTSLGVDVFLPCIMAFSEINPSVEFDLHFNDASVDLVENGFDIGIGTCINQDSRLIAKRLFSSKIGLYASRMYAEKHGLPQTFADLKHHQCLPIRSIESGKIRSVKLYDGDQEYLFTPQGIVTVDSFIAAKSMLCADWGIVGVGEWMIQTELEKEDVVPVLQEYWGPSIPVYLYFSSREYLPQSVRAFINFLSGADLYK